MSFAYLNLIANLSDNISFERIINEPKQGNRAGSTMNKIRDFAQMPSLPPGCFNNIMLSGIKRKGCPSHQDFANLILDLRKIGQLTITELIEEVLDKTGYILPQSGEFRKSGPASRISKVHLLLRILMKLEVVEGESGVKP